RRVARHVVQHLTRDHHVGRPIGEGQGIPVGEHGEESSLLSFARGRRNAFQSNGHQIDPVPAREVDRRDRDVTGAGAHIDHGPSPYPSPIPHPPSPEEVPQPPHHPPPPPQEPIQPYHVAPPPSHPRGIGARAGQYFRAEDQIPAR